MGGAEIGKIRSCYPVKLWFGEANSPPPPLPPPTLLHWAVRETLSCCPKRSCLTSGPASVGAVRVSLLLGRQTGLSALATLRDLLLELAGEQEQRAGSCACPTPSIIYIAASPRRMGLGYLTPSQLFAPLYAAWPACPRN